MKSDYVYPIEVLDEVLRWIRAMQPSLPLNMEPLLFVRRDMFSHPGPTALVTAPVMADSQEEAVAALAFLQTCPVLSQAVMRDVISNGTPRMPGFKYHFEPAQIEAIAPLNG